MVLQSGKYLSLEHRGQQIDSNQGKAKKTPQDSEKTQVAKLVCNTTQYAILNTNLSIKMQTVHCKLLRSPQPFTIS